MRHAKTMSVVLCRIILYSLLLLISTSSLYAGTTPGLISLGSQPITMKDIKSGEETPDTLYTDVETEIFICDEQEKEVGTSQKSLGTETCERHCLTCPKCGGPGKDQCNKNHTREREVPIKKCDRTISQIVEAAKNKVLRDLKDKKVTSGKGKSVYPFKPGEDGNVLAEFDKIIGDAIKDGEQDHSDFTQSGEQKGKISVSAPGHAGICEKSECELSYEQKKYAVTVHVKITIKLVKYLIYKDPIDGSPKKDYFTPKDDKEVFTLPYDERIPVGFRYKYTGKSSGWKVKNRCKCCKHEAGGEPVTTTPTITPLTPTPIGTPTATPITQPTPNPTPKPTPVPTPLPTPTPTPTPTPGTPPKKTDEPKKTGSEYREGIKLPASGALGSFIISPDTTVAVKAGGASSSFIINEQGKKTQELEKKGNYFIGKVPAIISGGIVTGSIVTALISTIKGGGTGAGTAIATTAAKIITPSMTTPTTPTTTATTPSPGIAATPSYEGITTPTRGIATTPAYDGTMSPPIKATVPNVDMNNLDKYNLTAAPKTGEAIHYGSPDLYLIDNKTNTASTVHDIASNPLPAGETRLTLTDPKGDVIDEKDISVYSYNLAFSAPQVTRGVPVTGNGTVVGLDGTTPVEVTLTFDPILDVTVAAGEITRKAPGLVTYKTTVNQLNLQPADFVFDTSKGMGKQDVIMTVTPEEVATDKQDIIKTRKPGKTDLDEQEIIRTIKPGEVDR